MSRSYKKTPVCKDGNASKKYGKRQANKRLRNMPDSEEIGGKSNNYKKKYEQWNICDYRFYDEKKAGMEKDDLQRWTKWYYRK